MAACPIFGLFILDTLDKRILAYLVSKNQVELSAKKHGTWRYRSYQNCPRNHLLMTRDISVKSDKKHLERSAVIKTASSTLERPISKLVLLLENRKNQEEIPVEESS